MILDLPKGWRREEIVGRPGLSNGKIDVHYYSPDGKCFKSKSEMQKFIGNSIDLSFFDFKSGKINSYLYRKNLKKSKFRSLMVPNRQTQSIFKQKVNVLKTQSDSKVNNEIKPVNSDKPKQVFWEKHLSSFNVKDDLDLPESIKPWGPFNSNSTIIRSISASLHTNNGIFGQTETKVLEKNPCVFINPEQPLISALIVTDEDIRKQEEKVLNARKKIELAMKENLID